MTQTVQMPARMVAGNGRWDEERGMTQALQMVGRMAVGMRSVASQKS